MGPKAPKEEEDELNLLDIDALEKMMEQDKSKLSEIKNRRNFVQQEREIINNFYIISQDEQKKFQAQIENLENEMERRENDHKNDINAFINKFKHLEYDNDIFINNTLVDNSKKAVIEEDKSKREREKKFLEKKQKLKTDIKEDSNNNREIINKRKTDLENIYKRKKTDLEISLKEVKNSYEKKLKDLEADLELRLRVDIHELEERKNLHINNLIEAFESRMNDWKKENINQIKDNIGLIKESQEKLKNLIDDNENLKKEITKLKGEKGEMHDTLKERQNKLDKINNKLAKYYNQEINLENMEAKIKSLRKKCDDTRRKTNDQNLNKEKLMKEIRQLKKSFEEAVFKFKERGEYKNNLLHNHIDKLEKNFKSRDEEIFHIIENIEQISRSGNNPEGITVENAKSILEDIRNRLQTKTQIIKNLKYSLSLATKAYNDTIRVYEAKLIEFGIPPEELGFQFFESNTSKMPAGLVAA